MPEQIYWRNAKVEFVNPSDAPSGTKHWKASAEYVCGSEVHKELVWFTDEEDAHKFLKPILPYLRHA